MPSFCVKHDSFCSFLNLSLAFPFLKEFTCGSVLSRGEKCIANTEYFRMATFGKKKKHYKPCYFTVKFKYLREKRWQPFIGNWSFAVNRSLCRCTCLENIAFCLCQLKYRNKSLVYLRYVKFYKLFKQVCHCRTYK